MVSKMQKLDASTLKYLVCVLMFVDHIHEMFAPLGLCPHWVDAFGRPVFPIFLFLAADSFHYTHDRKRYLLRLLVASWCMAAITMLTQYLVPSDSIVLMNNAFGTIFVSCLYMAVITLLREGHREKDKKKTRRGLGLLLLSFVGWIPVMIFMLSPMLPLASCRQLQRQVSFCQTSCLSKAVRCMSFWGFCFISSGTEDGRRYWSWHSFPCLRLW